MRRRIVVVFNASTSPMKEGYAVFDSNVIKLAQPGVFTDTLTEVLRSGARALLTQAVEAEVFSQSMPISGPRRAISASCDTAIFRKREIMTGIGPVAVRQPRVRDREAA